MLTGDYSKARDTLVKAKEMLKDFKGEAKDKAMLTNEIAFAFSVAKNEQALRILEAEKNVSKPAQNSSNTANTKENTNQ